MKEKKVDVKENKSNSKSQKVDMKQRDRLVFTIIIIVIIIGIVVCIVAFNGNKDDASSNNANGNSQNGTSQFENNSEDETLLGNGQIDYSNKANVVIKGKVKENNSKALAQEKELNGMRVKDIKLVAKSGVTNFVAKVENTTPNDFKGQKVVIIFKNEDGSEYDRLDSYLGDIKSGDSLEIDATTTSDLSNAYDCEIKTGE